MCVCEFCTEGDHKTHNTVTLEEETTAKKTQLMKTQTDVQQMIQDRNKKIQDIKHSEELRKKSAEQEKATSIELFSDLMHSIERCQAELLEMMEEKQKAAEKQNEELIQELQQEITELTMRNTELDHLLHTEDHLHLLQIDPSIQKLKESVLRRMQQYSVDVTLDPDTAHPYLILSDEGKQLVFGFASFLPCDLIGYPGHIAAVGCQGHPRSSVWMDAVSPTVKVTATHTSLCPSHRSVSDKPGHCAPLGRATPGHHTYTPPNYTAPSLQGMCKLTMWKQVGALNAGICTSEESCPDLTQSTTLE
ncbi:hypothetical protein QQF64_030839 [Cirrhinus molitorella]|uniref:SPRY-associated domain-containing protein n=1 Tax=Cirrhinus molitorella TaxID=172907 RepID=A0ABR3N4R8_9TELE